MWYYIYFFWVHAIIAIWIALNCYLFQLFVHGCYFKHKIENFISIYSTLYELWGIILIWIALNCYLFQLVVHSC